MLIKLWKKQINSQKNDYEPKILSSYLGISTKEITRLDLDNNYHYYSTSIVKKNGTRRQIFIPSKKLKILQRNFIDNYLIFLPTHPAATAFKCGSSAIINARHHVGQETIATLDLANFFGSICKEKIRNFFASQSWSKKDISIMSNFCCHRGTIPIGAPTSPYLSNLINFTLDEELQEISDEFGARYTRYSDDFTFSWATTNASKSFRACIENILANHNYQIQLKKGWRVYQRDQEPEITGVILGKDGKIRAPQYIHQQVNKLEQNYWFKKTPKRTNQLKGYKAYLKNFTNF